MKYKKSDLVEYLAQDRKSFKEAGRGRGRGDAELHHVAPQKTR